MGLPNEHYLAYRPPDEPAERRDVVQKLSALGAVRLHYSLWRISSEITKPVLRLLRGRHAIIMKRSRGIFASFSSDEKGVADLGTVAVIAYRLSQKSQQKRVAISRILSGLPAMKIGRCLYLVPYLKASRMAAYEGVVPTYLDLLKLLGGEGIRVSYMTHLRVEYPANQDLILKTFLEEQKHKIERFVLVCQRFMAAASTGKLNDGVSLRKLMSSYRHRYKLLKGLVFFLHREMNMDLRPDLRRAYIVLTSCRNLIESKPLSQMLPK
ncbi:hypothetical protein MUP77_09500 [Candidatus Bathyarchaeota archaeon]|nr:hypothetical protein [Candidatus Bathyarchaeota archaeon]